MYYKVLVGVGALLGNYVTPFLICFVVVFLAFLSFESNLIGTTCIHALLYTSLVFGFWFVYVFWMSFNYK